MVIWGAAGHARVLRDTLAGAGIAVAALADSRLVEPPWPGATVLTGLAALQAWLAGAPERPSRFLVAIGGARGPDRLRLAEALEGLGLAPLTLVHRAAVVEPSARLAPGAQVLAGAVVGAGAAVGRQSIVNTRAGLDHDSHLGAGCHLAPGVTVCGETEIGDLVFVGAGATIGPKLRVGEGATIGAGAVVLRDVAPGLFMVGVPARARR